MELGRKLKLCVGLSVIALILKIIVTASPGWVVVKRDLMMSPLDNIMPEGDGIRVEELPELMKPEKQRVTISFGLWYYKVCKCGRRDDDDDSSEEDSHENQDEMPEMSEEEKRRHHHKRHHHHGHHKCYHKCYRKNRHERKDTDVIPFLDEDVSEIPEEFRFASDFIDTAVEYARHGRLDLVWYISIGLALAMIGLIGAVVFARGRGLGKHSGRLACSTQILSAFFFWMTIIRIGTYIIQLKKVQEHDMMPGQIPKGVMFDCPWCLYVAAVGASIMGLVSLFHLIMVSRDRKTEVSEYSFKTQDKIPIIAPRGYDDFVVPSMEADPLPEKQPIT